MYKIEQIDGGVVAPSGFFADGVSAGLKSGGELDLGFIRSERPAKIGAVFTTNRMTASPIKKFQKDEIRETDFILVNSKNANAMTGEAGVSDIEEIFRELQSSYKLHNPVMSSTGVIGVRLPKDKIISGAKNFNLDSRNSKSFSQAVMTTDSYPKEIAFRVTLESGENFSIGGVAKGAGMINPSMATMLAFITTDAELSNGDINRLLRDEVRTTFNAISVDGDTSTNDSVFLLSNGESGVGGDSEAFREALHKVMEYLALQIVSDGEGAKKLVAFNITGASSDSDAEKVAKKLGDSLLVKTALFGEDPNWGRIASTVGTAGVECSEEKLSIAYEDVTVYDKGQNLFNDEVESRAYQVMKKDRFTINCDLGIGTGEFKSYACDLGYEYVKINADYRT
jgi:glutamate N-acetyltransferase/amino-acid N-acetyltransferase